MCGIFGIWSHPEAANLAYLGLHALQHRGQESAGIASTDGRGIYHHRAMGLVDTAFPPPALDSLKGPAAIGHVRYSTAGGSHIRNAQPFVVDCPQGSIAVAHNGNLINAQHLRKKLQSRGVTFSGTSDTEALAHMVAASKQPTAPEQIADALSQTRGAYSLVFLTQRQLIAARDPSGYRPLSLGLIQDVASAPPVYVVASEDSCFTLVGAQRIRDIEPGEILTIDDSGLHSMHFASDQHRLCVFEYVYFSRPDSILAGRSVYGVRKMFGRELAQEHPADCDIVIPVPDSGVASAMGYAEQIGRPFEMGLIRSHYIGRTFIEPRQSIRHFGVRLKFNPVADLIRGKKIVVVDDSIVRGTTIHKVVALLREAHAAEIHVRIASPPTAWPCYYGIDTPNRRQLIASRRSLEGIRSFVGATSLGYLSWDGVWGAVQQPGALPPIGLCGACFTGNYAQQSDGPVFDRQSKVVCLQPHDEPGSASSARSVHQDGH